MYNILLLCKKIYILNKTPEKINSSAFSVHTEENNSLSQFL